MITLKPRARPYESHTTPWGGYQTPKWRGFCVHGGGVRAYGATIRIAYAEWYTRLYGVPPLR